MPTARAQVPNVTPFAGFARSAPAFFHELAVEMNRDWFAANKERYDREWMQPMTSLLARVATGLAPAYRRLSLVPKVLRIHRDVRFSKDKTPYKTHVAGVLTVAGTSLAEGGNAAMYVHLGLDEEVVGVGLYHFDGSRLARWRKEVAGKPGGELMRLVTRLRKAGYTVGGHDDLKKVPRGLDPEHPRAELLKMRGLTGMLPPIPRGMIHKPGFADWLVTHGKALAPLVVWLHEHVE